MNILIACEESQRVCTAFRNKGLNAFSCDIEPCSGGHPEWHIKQDVLPLLNGNCSFHTCDGAPHTIKGKWDLIIAHPPCTYLTITGNRWFNKERYGDKAVEREKLRKEAADFFMRFANADCDHIAIENPIGYMGTHYRKADQLIHPYMFGHPTKKATCLWLKGLPVLVPTNIVKPVVIQYQNGTGADSEWHMQTAGLPPKERAKARSKTFEGIASAMGEQWGNYLLGKDK